MFSLVLLTTDSKSGCNKCTAVIIYISTTVMHVEAKTFVKSNALKHDDFKKKSLQEHRVLQK